MFEFLFYLLLLIVLGSINGLLFNINNSYMVVNKPIAVPGIVFPIVWTILYLILGYVGYRNRDNIKDKRLFYINLIINLLWLPIFYLGNYLQSFIIIIILIIITIIMLVRYYKNDSISFYLMIPYLLWILFAAYLNYGVYLLNK